MIKKSQCRKKGKSDLPSLNSPFHVECTQFLDYLVSVSVLENSKGMAELSVLCFTKGS